MTLRRMRWTVHVALIGEGGKGGRKETARKKIWMKFGV
jgi:hypothetical protein